MRCDKLHSTGQLSWWLFASDASDAQLDRPVSHILLLLPSTLQYSYNIRLVCHKSRMADGGVRSDYDVAVSS